MEVDHYGDLRESHLVQFSVISKQFKELGENGRQLVD